MWRNKSDELGEKVLLGEARDFNASSSLNIKVSLKWTEIQDCLFKKEYTWNKGGAYLIIIDEYKSIGTHWIALYVNGNTVTYFDSFGAEHTPKESRNLSATKILEQTFIGHKHTSKWLKWFNNVDTFVVDFVPKVSWIILIYFLLTNMKRMMKMKKIYCIICDQYKKFKNPKHHRFLKKH